MRAALAAAGITVSLGRIVVFALQGVRRGGLSTTATVYEDFEPSETNTRKAAPISTLHRVGATHRDKFKTTKSFFNDNEQNRQQLPSNVFRLIQLA